LRSVILNVFDNRAKYGKIDIIYGARSRQDLVFTSEYEEWQKVDDTRLHLTVDRGDENWKGNVGLVPTFLREIHPSPENTISITCGLERTGIPQRAHSHHSGEKDEMRRR
jgi:NAD(P)H-flavin reductase